VRPATESASTPLTPLRWPRCGAEGIGRYCSTCGNLLGGRRDPSVKHFLKEAALAVTDFDSALIRQPARERFFAEHLVFSTHFVSFLLLAIPVAGLLMGVVFRLINRLGGPTPADDDETAYISTFTAIVGLYAYLGQRRAYASGRLPALIRTGVICASLVPMIVAFKFVLFLATLAWIG